MTGEFERKRGKGRKRHTYTNSLRPTEVLASNIEPLRVCNIREEQRPMVANAWGG